MPRRPLKPVKSRRDWSAFWVILGIAAVLAIIVTWCVLYFGSVRTETGCVVDSKERYTSFSSSKDGTKSEQKKLVYTSCGVFNVDDNFFLGKFNSADTYGSLHEGDTFDLEIVGWRNGFLSWFPNVLSAEKTS